jgi:hypothetical protein
MNPLDGLPEYDDRGNPPSLGDFRRLGELARRVQTPDAADGAMDAGEGGFAYTPPPDTSLWARLTAAGTGTYLGKYSWKQVQDDGTGAAVDAPGGMVGAFDGSTGPPAREVTLATGLTVGATTGQVVRMWLAESGEFYWFREAAPPGTFTLTVRGSTGTPSYSPVSFLEFVGGTLTNPSAGVARWAPPAAFITVTEAEEGGAGALTFTGVSEFQTDLGEITDNGGTPRVVRQGFCARNLAFDFNLGDSAFSVPNGAYTAPTAVTFPNFGAGFVIAPQWSSAEFSTVSGVPSAVIKLPRSGIYLLCAAVEWAANATGYRYVEIQNVEDGKVYGGLRDLRAAVSGVSMYQTVSGPSPIDGGYTYRLRAAQNSGGSLSILSAFLSAVKIG